MRTTTHDLTRIATVAPRAVPARRTAARRRHTIRIATISAIGALLTFAFAATAAARPCSCDDPAQEAQVTQTWIAAQRHQPRGRASLSPREKRPPHLRYDGRDATPVDWWVPRGFDALNLLLAEGHYYPSMGWL